MFRQVIVGTVFFLLVEGAVGSPSDRCEDGVLVQGPCLTIQGEMSVWNGWPPYLRIESGGRVYGVGPVENEIFPAAWTTFMPTAVRGDFRVCPLGTESNAPYLVKPIALYCIESAVNAERQSEEGARWVPIK